MGVGPKRKWLGQRKMLGSLGWVKKKLLSTGGWVKKILGIITRWLIIIMLGIGTYSNLHRYSTNMLDNKCT
jgi:hypothetical protein